MDLEAREPTSRRPRRGRAWHHRRACRRPPNRAARASPAGCPCRSARPAGRRRRGGRTPAARRSRAPLRDHGEPVSIRCSSRAVGGRVDVADHCDDPPDCGTASTASSVSSSDAAATSAAVPGSRRAQPCLRQTGHRGLGHHQQAARSFIGAPPPCRARRAGCRAPNQTPWTCADRARPVGDVRLDDTPARLGGTDQQFERIAESAVLNPQRQQAFPPHGAHRRDVLHRQPAAVTRGDEPGCPAGHATASCRPVRNRRPDGHVRVADTNRPHQCRQLRGIERPVGIEEADDVGGPCSRPVCTAAP